ARRPVRLVAVQVGICFAQQAAVGARGVVRVRRVEVDQGLVATQPTLVQPSVRVMVEQWQRAEVERAHRLMPMTSGKRPSIIAGPMTPSTTPFHSETKRSTTRPR